MSGHGRQPPSSLAWDLLVPSRSSDRLRGNELRKYADGTRRALGRRDEWDLPDGAGRGMDDGEPAAPSKDDCVLAGAIWSLLQLACDLARGSFWHSSAVSDHGSRSQRPALAGDF